MARRARSLFENISLKNRVFFFNAIIIVVTLFTLGFFATSISSGAIIEKAEKSSARELELIDRNLETMTSSMEDYIRVIATDYRLQEQLLEYSQMPGRVDESLKSQQIRSVLSEILSNIISPNTQVLTAAVLSPDHQFFYYSSAINISKLGQVFNDDFLNYAAREQTPVWTGLFRLEFNDRTDAENAVAVTKLVIDKNLGHKTGFVVLFVSEKNMSMIFPEQAPNGKDRYYIADGDNRVISSQNKSDLFQGLGGVLGIGQTDFDALLRNGKIISWHNGKNYLYSVQSFNKLGWKVVSAVSLEEITSESAKIQSVIVIVGTLCLLFAFVISYSVSHAITRPIHRLAGIMNDILDGDMSIRAETDIRGEVGVLSKGFNNLMDRIEALLDEVYSEQSMRRDFEFRLIQSQIKPHFLYNSLETIISLNKLGRYEDAISITKSLASFYRYSLSKGNDMIKVSEEADLTDNYLAIQKMRYSNFMEYSISVEDGVGDMEIPKLTLQPLVENSIYHGLKPKEGKGKLEIRAYLFEGVVCLEVFDNGVGIPADKISSLLDEPAPGGKSEDFGLASVNKRIKLLYGNQYGIFLQSEMGTFTKVTLKIPAVKRKG